MAMLNKPAEEEEEEQEEKVVEEQPEIIEDDLIKTPGRLNCVLHLLPQTKLCI